MKGDRSNWLARLLPPVIVLVAATGLLEAYLRIAHVKSYNMALPSEILRAMVIDGDELRSAMIWTALAALGGFAASGVIGVSLAVALCSSALLRRALYPYTVFFQTIPIIAIAPLLVLWFSAGIVPVTVCAFIVSVFPVITNTLSGLMSTEPALADLFRLYGGGRVATMLKLRLPAALPNIFTGLRVAAGLSVIGTVATEFLVGETVGGKMGLGVIIIDGTHNVHLDKAFAAVLLASTLGLMMFAAVNLGARLSLRHWHASER